VDVFWKSTARLFSENRALLWLAPFLHEPSRVERSTVQGPESLTALLAEEALPDPAWWVMPLPRGEPGTEAVRNGPDVLRAGRGRACPSRRRARLAPLAGPQWTPAIHRIPSRDPPFCLQGLGLRPTREPEEPWKVLGLSQNGSHS